MDNSHIKSFTRYIKTFTEYVSVQCFFIYFVVNSIPYMDHILKPVVLESVECTKTYEKSILQLSRFLAIFIARHYCDTGNFTNFLVITYYGLCQAEVTTWNMNWNVTTGFLRKQVEVKSWNYENWNYYEKIFIINYEMALHVWVKTVCLQWWVNISLKSSVYFRHISK